MISNSLCAEEEVLFSSPESLEQLRVELLSMGEEHQRTAEQLPGELVALHALLSAEPAAVFPLELLREAEFQLRERSACVVTLAQLAVRLVEGLRDQQLQHLHLLDRYEHEAETLRDLNDCLAHRNRHIEVLPPPRRPMSSTSGSTCRPQRASSSTSLLSRSKRGGARRTCRSSSWRASSTASGQNCSTTG